jgi:DNA gyrase subunit B
MSNYTTESITLLEGLDPIRKRPGMYIGSLDEKGLLHLVREVLNNSIDERLQGYRTYVFCELSEDKKQIIIQDNGRGIPVGINEKTKLDTLELIFCRLHSGGKFDDGAYKISGGLHGIGLSAVNALSVKVELEIKRDGFVYYQNFINQKPEFAVSKKEKYAGKDTGTKITFTPDFDLFDAKEFDANSIEELCHKNAYLNSKILFSFKHFETKEFFYTEGLKAYRQSLLPPEHILKLPIAQIEKPVIELGFEVGLTWIDDFDTNIVSFVNGIFTNQGGAHVTSLRNGIVRAANYLKKEYMNKLPKNLPEILKIEHIEKGLIAVLSAKVPGPVFEGQTKNRLIQFAKTKETLESVIREAIKNYLVTDLNLLLSFFSKIQENIQYLADLNSLKTNQKKSKNTLRILPGKLTDSMSRDIALNEIFIVEGNSAGGSSKSARNKVTQAILPIKGKILNVEKSTIQQYHANKEIRDLLQAIGLDDTKEQLIEEKLKKVRYGKIILMADADIDGKHIVTLLLAFFNKNFKFLFDRKRIYLAQPPLYCVFKGKFKKYLYNEKELKNYESEGYLVKRYKGLGVMNPDELWETTMNPETRKLIQIVIEDKDKAEDAMQLFMGKEVAGRKEKILQSAGSDKYNLDTI